MTGPRASSPNGVGDEVSISLVFSWKWSGAPAELDPNESLVEITLDDRRGSTKTTLLHSGLVSVESRNEHHEGWSGSFDRLLLRSVREIHGLTGWNELTC